MIIIKINFLLYEHWIIGGGGGGGSRACRQVFPPLPHSTSSSAPPPLILFVFPSSFACPKEMLSLNVWTFSEVISKINFKIISINHCISKNNLTLKVIPQNRTSHKFSFKLCLLIVYVKGTY